MIVRETQESFILIKQHDHAAASGVCARQWKDEFFPGPELRKSVEFAAQQHDRGWINLDDVPFWNDKTSAPYSFIDIPDAAKITHYKAGIDEIAEQDSYAGLLCSLHFTAFPDLLKIDAGKKFFAYEEQRRENLMKELLITTAAQKQLLQQHYQLLKFCDGLSIYACLNEPGATKENEHEWFLDGIPDSEKLFGFGGHKIEASWVGANKINVSPSPFAQEFDIIIKLKELPKQVIKQAGLAAAYSTTAEQEYQISII